MSASGSSISYGYNADGKRISKTVNGTTYNYSYLGDQLTEMTWGSNKLHFTYDSLGPASVTYNGNRYFYRKLNLFIGIIKRVPSYLFPLSM